MTLTGHTAEEITENYFEIRDKYILEHEADFDNLFQTHLNMLGLTPDDERKDLIGGIRDYTFLILCGEEAEGMAMLLLNEICKAYPVIGIKIKRNYTKYCEGTK